MTTKTNKYIASDGTEFSKRLDMYVYEEKLILDKLATKLENKDELTEDEIRYIVRNVSEVYREEGDDRRWSKSISTVHKVGDKLYNIDWEEGLTELQEDEFFTQPYQVTLETEIVQIEKTKIVPV